MKLWRVFLWLIPFPGIVSAFWYSAPKKTRERAKKTATRAKKDFKDVFFEPIERMYTHTFEQMLSEKLNRLNGEPFNFSDFDVGMVEASGDNCGWISGSRVLKGEHGILPAGTYGEMVFRSPSMEAYKYAPMSTLPEFEYTKIECDAVRSVEKWDTYTMALPVDHAESGKRIGIAKFRWEVI